MAAPDLSNVPDAAGGWRTLRRFLPYLWPRHAPALRVRVVIAVVLVLAAKGVSLSTGFVYKAAVDNMSAGMTEAAGLAIALVVAYAGARFAGVFFENVRNAIFERVGLDAARRFADAGLPPHPRSVAALPPRAAHRRAHQGRRAGHQEHRHDALFPPLQHRADRRSSCSSSASSSA
jgi:hypothetical protein